MGFPIRIWMLFVPELARKHVGGGSSVHRVQHVVSLHPSPMAQSLAHLHRQPPVAPMGPRFLWGDLPWGPWTPQQLPPAEPASGCCHILLNSTALTFFSRNASGLGTAGQSHRTQMGLAEWKAPCAAPLPRDPPQARHCHS